MNTTRTRRALGALAATLAISLTAGSATAGAPTLSAHERNTIRAATKQFRSLDAALAAGYVPAGGCAEHPELGGMGYHYLHPGHASDTVVDPATPEILVYVPDRHGRLRLGAVEYFVADADQDLTTDTDRPTLFDRYALDGPMPGHEPGMPVHYDLHVWLYAHNPAGELVAFNPKVSCDG